MVLGKDRLSFAPDELLPVAGGNRAVTSRENLSAAAEWNNHLRSIYIHNPTFKPVFQALDMVITLGNKGFIQMGVRNAAPSYAGKSASADEFARIVERRGETNAGERPVVRVELEQACTSKRFWGSILMAYGDGFSAHRDEEGLRRSAYDAFEKFNTKLLIVDEVQHAGYRSKGSSAPTDVIKRFISDAQVGVGLFGNEDAKTLLESNNQLSHRLLSPCDIKPLNVHETADQGEFARFLKKYDAALAEKKLFPRLSGLNEERTVACLMQVSNGFLGRVVTLIQVAAVNAFLRGAEMIEIFDLSHACTHWAVEQRLTPHDPFRYGLSVSA